MPLVHFFNTHLTGGAASAAISVFNSLSPGIDGQFFFSQGDPLKSHGARLAEKFVRRDPKFLPRSGPDKFVNSIKARRHYARLKRYEKGRPEGLEQFSFSRQYLKTPYGFFGPLPDVIHLHWIAEWIDFPSFFESIPDEVPIVWSLHDMNPFTGGCHYSGACSQYLSYCHHCPQLGPYKNGNLVSESWESKWRALEHKNLHIIANSNWMEQEARKSGLLKNARSFQTIPLGVDTDVFTPGSRQTTKDTITIVFGAASLTNKRKGLFVLQGALKILFSKYQHIECIVFGSSQAELGREMPRVKGLGFIENQEQLAAVYNKADIFVIPSLQEAFGLTSLEAMACGIPVVGFDVGGLRDTIKDGETGLLARPGDDDDLAAKIEVLICNAELRRKMSMRALELVKRSFSCRDQADRYNSFYESLLSAA